MQSSSSYVMTMTFSNVSTEFLSTRLALRAYAKLSDGSYEYSEVYKTTVFTVAEVLYTGKQMSTKEQHDYLYNRILHAVNNQYVPINYN